MGLLSRGSRPGDLPALADRRRRRGAGDQLGVGRSQTPEGPAGSAGIRGAGRPVGTPMTPVPDTARLERLLGGELTWLVERVRKRLERGETLDTSVTLTGATPAQRDAVHRL